MQHLIERIRFCHYISGVLANQAADPLCCKCRAFANTIRAVKEEAEGLKEAGAGGLPPEILELLEKAGTVIHSLQAPDNTEGQKKAGNCKMPKGVCFVKSSKAVLKEI